MDRRFSFCSILQYFYRATKWHKDITKKTLVQPKRYWVYFWICQILWHFSSFRAFSWLKVSALSCKTIIFRISSKNWVYLYDFYWFSSSFNFFERFTCTPFNVGWKNECYRNFVLMMRMWFLTFELVIELHYRSDETLKTCFRWNSFFHPILRGSTGKSFDKNETR